MLPKNFRWKDYGNNDDFKNIYYKRKIFRLNCKSSSIFGVKDLDIKLFEYLDLKTLNSLSLTNYNFNDLFFNDNVWLKKISKDFPCLCLSDIRENLNYMSYMQYYIFLKHIFQEIILSYVSAQAQEWKRKDLIKILNYKNVEPVILETFSNNDYRYNKSDSEEFFEGKSRILNYITSYKNDQSYGPYKIKDNKGRTLISVEQIDDDNYMHQSFDLHVYEYNTAHKSDFVIEILILMQEDINAIQINNMFEKEIEINFEKEILNKYIYSNKQFEGINLYNLISPSRFSKLFKEGIFTNFSREIYNIYGTQRHILKNNEVIKSLSMAFEEIALLYNANNCKYKFISCYMNNKNIQSKIDIEFHYKEFLKSPLKYIARLIEEYKNDELSSLLNYITEGFYLERLNITNTDTDEIFKIIDIVSAKTGNIQAMEYNFIPDYKRSLYISAKHGKSKLLKYIITNKKCEDFDYDKLLYNAGKSGNIKLVRYLFFKIDRSFNDINIQYTINGATKKEKLGLFKYLTSLNTIIDYEKISEICCENRSMEIIDHLISKNIFNFESGLLGASKGKHKDLVIFCIENGAKDFESALNKAIEGEDLELVKYFISKGAKDIDEALNSCVQFAVDNDITEYLEGLECLNIQENSEDYQFV